MDLTGYVDEPVKDEGDEIGHYVVFVVDGEELKLKVTASV